MLAFAFFFVGLLFFLLPLPKSHPHCNSLPATGRRELYKQKAQRTCKFMLGAERNSAQTITEVFLLTSPQVETSHQYLRQKEGKL